jgi:tRNA modification GTPase
MFYSLEDTIVALATPAGIGAIAVIRLSGTDAIEICNNVFYGKDLKKQKSHTIHFGTIRNEQNIVIDEVLASLFVAPKSYTKENVIEVSCHGSPYIIQQLIQLFLRHGARMAQPGEFTLRAFLNGGLDLSQAEAVADLIASNSEVAHRTAMQQMRGGFSQEISQLREKLVNFASLIELELDFGEEDVEFADRHDLKNLVSKIQQYIHQLLTSFSLGNVLKNGVATVIAGRPNAGKSTLLNALLNEERAIVSSIAGTTRDTIEEILNINGIQFRLIDTAGIREATDQIEAIGVARTMEKIEQATLLVYVFDVLKMQPEDVQSDIQKLMHDGIKVLAIANKMDLFRVADMADFAFEGFKKEQFIPISAAHDMNIEYLKERLYTLVINEGINLDNTIITNTRHYEALNNAYTSLSDVLTSLENGITTDFVAMDIRRALRFLGEVTGEVTTEDLLGNIFSKFCIGK